MPIREISLETYDPGCHEQKLRQWLQQPHVGRWWGDPSVALENSRQCSPEKQAVIVTDGDPVGYMCWQTPPRDELKAAGLADLPQGLMDIDILIGEAEVTGRGIGPTCLGLLLARLRADPLVTVAGVGTSVANERAIRAFEKAGFRLFREFKDPEFGSCRYMVVDLTNRSWHVKNNPVVHFEIGCHNGGKTREFFAKLFDWDISGQDAGMIIDTGGAEGIGGHIVELAPEWGNYVTVYVQVEDLEAYLKKAGELGGKTLVSPVSIPGQGSFAWLAAPEGNIIGIWKAEKEGEDQ